MRRLIVIGALVSAALMAPALARAGTFSESGSTLTFTAAPGEANHVSISIHHAFGLSDTFSVSDSGAASTYAAGCGVDTVFHYNYCTLTGITSIVLNLGDGDDYATVSGEITIPVTYYGGDGATDTVDFGARTAPMSISLDGIANDGPSGNAHDNVEPDVENVIAGSGNDTLTGDALHANDLVGNDGNDVIVDDGCTSGAGVIGDQLVGGAGDDSITWHEHDPACALKSVSGGDGQDVIDVPIRPTSVVTTAVDAGPGDDEVTA
jgi:hypothetical protein